MNNKRSFLKTGQAGCVLNTVLLMALAEWVGDTDGQGIRITVPAPVIVVAPVVVVPDNFVYYPAYGIYFNTTRHEYAYKDHDAWVSRPVPFGVTADVLLASPSVKMDFHDSPANHHEAMVRQYPKDYKAARSDQKIDRHDGHDGHDEHDRK